MYFERDDKIRNSKIRHKFYVVKPLNLTENNNKKIIPKANHST